MYRLTLERAREVGLTVETVPGWYDVDDASSFQILEDELSGRQLSFVVKGLVGANAPATRQFIRERQSPVGGSDVTMRFPSGPKIVQRGDPLPQRRGSHCGSSARGARAECR